ncbi:Uncharacterised protein r2_g3704 [Pycnogonum litorale]
MYNQPTYHIYNETTAEKHPEVTMSSNTNHDVPKTSIESPQSPVRNIPARHDSPVKLRTPVRVRPPELFTSSGRLVQRPSRLIEE